MVELRGDNFNEKAGLLSGSHKQVSTGLGTYWVSKNNNFNGGLPRGVKTDEGSKDHVSCLLHCLFNGW